MKELPKVKYYGRLYYVDFRLGELRSVTTARTIKFTRIKAGKNSPIKKKLRVIRFRHWRNEYIAGVDD